MHYTLRRKTKNSTVFEQTADQVWAVIRDFGNYTVWVEGVSKVLLQEHLENPHMTSKPGRKSVQTRRRTR